MDENFYITKIISKMEKNIFGNHSQLDFKIIIAQGVTYTKVFMETP